MWANHPEIAERWTHEHGSKPQPETKSRSEHFKDGHKKDER